jgi:LAGLIDADG endonuclease
MKNKINPNWITGFVDGEGCFLVHIGKRKNPKSGWHIQPCFQIKLHIKDKDLLLNVKSFFNEIGTINLDNKYNKVVYKVYKLNDIVNIIIPHFDKYLLITQKYSDYILWKSIVKIIDKGKHLNSKGLLKIVSLKASLNKGLSDKLKKEFPATIKVKRSKVNIPNIIDYNWIAGFFSGEGCFFIDIYKATDCKMGCYVRLRASVSQHSRDEILINNLINRLNCGFVTKHTHKKNVTYVIYRFEDIYNKIIPIFNKYPILSVKSLDFKDFCKAAELINKKAHLTLEGLDKISKIKSNMNTGRIFL